MWIALGLIILVGFVSLLIYTAEDYNKKLPKYVAPPVVTPTKTTPAKRPVTKSPTTVSQSSVLETAKNITTAAKPARKRRLNSSTDDVPISK